MPADMRHQLRMLSEFSNRLDAAFAKAMSRHTDRYRATADRFDRIAATTRAVDSDAADALRTAAPPTRHWRAAPTTNLTFGGLTLKPPNVAELPDGSTVDLWPNQFALLKLLVSNHGKLLSHDRIIDEVWGHRGATRQDVGGSLYRLRKRIGESPEIYSVRSRGYVLREPGAFLDPNLADDALRVGPVTLSKDTQTATSGDRPLTLTPRQFITLEWLMRNADRVVTRERLATLVRSDSTNPADVVNVHISNLRKALEAGGEPRLIVAESGGYSLTTKSLTSPSGGKPAAGVL